MQQMATEHKEIGHTEQERHFVQIYQGDGPFGGLVVRPFLDAIKADLHYPALVVPTYDWDYLDNQDNRLKKYKCGYLVFCRAKSPREEDMNEALDKAERIGEQVLAGLEQHFQDFPSSKAMRFAGSSGEYVVIEESELAGVRFNFTFLSSAASALKYDASKWL